MTPASYLAPAWAVAPQGDALRVLDLERGDSFDVRGELTTLLEQDRTAALRALHGLAQFEPAIARFASDYATGRFVPFTRATLLEGSGFEQLFLELTARCNERCAHCYAESSPERHEALSLPVIERVLCDARELGFEAVQLTGGDPLISPHCARAAQLVRDLGFSALEIYTNGLALRGELYEQLRELRASFAFSFYSSDPQVHDAVTRTPGSQARTLAAIRRVLADDLPVRASIIVSELNRHTLTQTVALLRECGVPRERIAIDQVREVGRGEYRAALADALGEDALSHHAGTKLRGFSGKASVAADGGVHPCIFSRKRRLGNVHEHRLTEILGDRTPFAFDALAAFARAGSLTHELTCWECRLRNAALDSAEALVPLRAKPR